MKTKYIVFKQDHLEDIIIFSGLQQHVDIANKLNLTVVSAGFIKFVPLEDYIECYGDSFSLKVKSRPEEDAQIARRALGMYDD